MIYKNKNIRSVYSVMFGTFLVGAFFMGLVLLSLVAGLVSTIRALDNIQHIDTALQAPGRTAGKAVSFICYKT